MYIQYFNHKNNKPVHMKHGRDAEQTANPGTFMSILTANVGGNWLHSGERKLGHVLLLRYVFCLPSVSTFTIFIRMPSPCHLNVKENCLPL